MRYYQIYIGCLFTFLMVSFINVNYCLASDGSFVPEQGVYYKIKHVDTGRVLNVLHAHIHDTGHEVFAWKDDGTYESHRSFKFVAAGDGYYFIKNKESGQVLNAFDADNLYYQWHRITSLNDDGNFHNHRAFAIVSSGDGYYHIKNKVRAELMSIDNEGHDKPDGVPVRVNTWPLSLYHRFTFVKIETKPQLKANL